MFLSGVYTIRTYAIRRPLGGHRKWNKEVYGVLQKHIGRRARCRVLTMSYYLFSFLRSPQKNTRSRTIPPNDGRTAADRPPWFHVYLEKRYSIAISYVYLYLNYTNMWYLSNSLVYLSCPFDCQNCIVQIKVCSSSFPVAQFLDRFLLIRPPYGRSNCSFSNKAKFAASNASVTSIWPLEFCGGRRIADKRRN